MDLEYSYKYDTDRDRHTWSAKADRGGVHIWAQRKSSDLAERFGYLFVGGIECHWPSDSETADNADCWLIDGPCKHDGSSLYFSENIEPMLRSIIGPDVPNAIHEYINSELFDWYRAKIDKSEQIA